jgi:mono/diheme cytochrome c family protein
MRRIVTGAVLVLAALLFGFGTDPAFAQQKPKKMSAEAKRGRYLVQTSGCNDCHTPGYPESGGKVDEKLWLTGSPLGWRGPWGTTYPPNLRLDAQKLSEADFVKLARSELRPPMPWFNLRDMTTNDVRAIYQYLKYAGPAGQPAPAYVPPDKEPMPPFVQFPAQPPEKK